MGRDMSNCETGTVCCGGACYKLVDEKHNLIMKGCTNEDEEDGSMKRKTLNVKLYWVRNEKVTGKAYYCKGSEYCNASSVSFNPRSFFCILFSLLIILTLSKSYDCFSECRGS